MAKGSTGFVKKNGGSIDRKAKSRWSGMVIPHGERGRLARFIARGEAQPPERSGVSWSGGNPCSPPSNEASRDARAPGLPQWARRGRVVQVGEDGGSVRRRRSERRGDNPVALHAFVSVSVLGRQDCRPSFPLLPRHLRQVIGEAGIGPLQLGHGLGAHPFHALGLLGIPGQVCQLHPLQPGAMRGDGAAGLKKQIPSSCTPSNPGRCAVTERRG